MKALFCIRYLLLVWLLCLMAGCKYECVGPEWWCPDAAVEPGQVFCSYSYPQCSGCGSPRVFYKGRYPRCAEVDNPDIIVDADKCDPLCDEAHCTIRKLYSDVTCSDYSGAHEGTCTGKIADMTKMRTKVKKFTAVLSILGHHRHKFRSESCSAFTHPCSGRRKKS
jgi:hypothetical protein